MIRYFCSYVTRSVILSNKYTLIVRKQQKKEQQQLYSQNVCSDYIYLNVFKLFTNSPALYLGELNVINFLAVENVINHNCVDYQIVP